MSVQRYSSPLIDWSRIAGRLPRIRWCRTSVPIPKLHHRAARSFASFGMGGYRQPIDL